MGLLADTQTRVVFRQSTDQLDEARQLLGLTSVETDVVARLGRGRALWKIGEKGVVVDHAIGSSERVFCDTDAAMVQA
jgi:hypothetical protein